MHDTALILLLLVATNAAPILAARIFRSVAEQPLDGGWRMGDGRALLGNSKTWRGLIAALAVACVVAVLAGFSFEFGLVFGLLTMTGDLLSSFVKRRKGLAPSDQCLGVDQLPESLLPSVYSVAVLGLQWWWVIVLPLTFMLLELFISRPLYWLKIRKRPY